ncbi:MAG: TolC family protein [Gammaproteobacteria bacterium]|nr:TolC family protein [Gammaproteobacteria bacterium]
MINLKVKRGLFIAISFVSVASIIDASVVGVSYAGVVNNTVIKQTSKVTRSKVILQRWLNKNVNNHPLVLAAKSAVDTAGYQLVAADKALYNPELEFDTETAETDSTSIGLSQTIDWGDTRGARTAVAGSRKTAARYALESSRREVAIAFLGGLSGYQMTMALRELAEQTNTLMQRSAKLARQRFDAGDLNKVEVDLANLTFAQARFKRADAVSQHARAVQNLISLSGSVNTDWSKLASLLADLDMPDPVLNQNTKSQEIEKSVRRLPRMREILSRVKAAQANVKVQAGLGTVNPTITIRAGKEEQDTLLGLNLSIPLQVRNNFRAEISAANAEMIQTERESVNDYRKLKSRLEVAIISYQLSREAWQAWEKSGANTLNEQIKLLERLWKAGELNTTDYLIQLNQALQTKASAIEQRGRMLTDWSEWLIASGKIGHWLNNQQATNTRDK